MRSVADLPRLLDAGLTLKPGDVALVSPQGQLSWRDLETASLHYAQNLIAAGLRPGDRVASLLPNSDALVIHYLGCFKAGLVATPLNYRYTPPEIDHALKTSGASMLLFDAARIGDIAASEAAAKLQRGLICWGAATGQIPTFEEFLSEPEKLFPLSGGVAGEPAAIFFTSGSTGPAKGVTHSVSSIGSMLASLVKACQTGPDDIVAAFGSISHIGAFADIFMGLWAGARIVIPESLDGDGLLSTLRQHRPTIGCALPVTLFGLVRNTDAKPEDFASLRICGSGGDKVSAELQRELSALSGPLINEQYGMTEFGIATVNPCDGEIKAGSAGRAIDGYELEIRDPEGSPVPPGMSGRLWVKSNATMTGYWNDGDATRRVLVNGWLDTGDVFIEDRDGYFWFQGRQKQIIVHNGSNITPQEVEEALLQHKGVAMAGVVGVPDVVHGENVRAFVVLKPDGPTYTMVELIAFVRARIGYKTPDDIFVLESMPLTASDKVDRVALKRMSDQIPGRPD